MAVSTDLACQDRGCHCCLFALLLAFLTVSEYRPAAQETLDIKSGDTKTVLKEGSSLSVMTWNVGYGALGDNADFFMDGGKSVQTADTARVNQNLTGIADEIKSVSPDIVFLQEVDINSSRSHDIDEAETIETQLQAANAAKLSNSTLAYNFKVAFIPYPIPPIGKVNGGILTLSNYSIESSDALCAANTFQMAGEIRKSQTLPDGRQDPSKQRGRQCIRQVSGHGEPTSGSVR